jgi:2-oxoglutarate/2-oxoacid ferredoxin oxidoreductase subunit alpha
MRLRAYPFPESVKQFIAGHDKVFVVEQNRDAQMHTLLVEAFEIDPARLIKVLHYDGTPITARFISKDIAKHVRPVDSTNQQKEAA